MHRPYLRMTALLLSLLLLLSGCAAAEKASPTPAPTLQPDSTQLAAEPTPLPTNEKGMPYLLSDIEGSPMTFSDLKGKVVYLNFFTTWCGYCKEEMPDILKLQQKYGEALSVVLIHVPDRDTEEAAHQFLKDNGLDSLRMVEDTNLVLTNFYGLTGYPLSVIIDKEGFLASKLPIDTEGNVTGYQGGAMTYEQMEELMQIAGLEAPTAQ